MANWQDIRKDLLKDPEVREACKTLAPEIQLARSLIRARLESKLTQSELAQRANISQVMVARLESGNSNPTIATVSKVARVLDKELKLVPTGS